MTTVCMFVGLLLNAFVIGSMASALSSFDSRKAVRAATRDASRRGDPSPPCRPAPPDAATPHRPAALPPTPSAHPGQMCREKIETIGNYLRIHSVPNDLRERIVEFYEYLYTSGTAMEELQLLKDLPSSLATRLAINVHRRVVTRASLFTGLSDRAMLGVLARLSPVIFVPGQVRQRTLSRPCPLRPVTCRGR